MTSEFEPIDRLTKDLRKASATLNESEARYLVDQYYVLQDARIRAQGQIRSMSETKEPHEVLVWFGNNASTLENQIKSALKKFSEGRRPGRWLMAQYGIGPVISAGLLAHIDIKKAKSAGAIWRYAGLDPTVKWEKGQKRPWNAELKVLAWKASDSFKKFSNKDECFYGKIYRERKTQEVKRNSEFLFKDQAAQVLVNKNYRRDTKAKAAYENGQLPDGHLDARAMRYASKIFLSHLHHVMWICEFNTNPPKPFVIEHMGHIDMIQPPNWPVE